MQLTTIKRLTLSALVLNLLSIAGLTKWQIGKFHLTATAAICAGLCVGWCVISLGIVMFRDWKAPHDRNDHVKIDIDSEASFSYKKLSAWEKFGVAIIFIVDFFINAVWVDTFIIFFFLFWMITFRIGHQHVTGKNGYHVVGTMLWPFLAVLWLVFATNI
ncbi:hypothetical protein [Levilactobacillus enshiensis]|uniref:hypothetical protein n=1 Tax=Levilactobacillus enshiensis TaxID=2590213 RepID=UPI00117B6489|nr:hypothetical protein [Levilactobacillus enshiensis]